MPARFDVNDPEKVAAILKARQSGMEYKAIAAALGCSKDTVHRVLKKHGVTRKYLLRSPRSANERSADPELKQRAREMWLKVPVDDRDLTARLMGDPLRGRSALDQISHSRVPPL